MEELTPKEKRKLEKIVKIVEDGPLAVAEHLLEIEDEFEAKVQEIKDNLPNLNKILETIKGKDGEDGEQGDIGEKGDKGDKGDRGEKGDNGKDGKDGKDGRDGRDGRDGVDGKDGLDGKDGENGKDGSSDTPDEVVEKINKSKKKIKSSQVEGLDDIERIAKSNSQPVTTNFFNGLRAKNLQIQGSGSASISAVQQGDTVILTVNATGGGTGFTKLTTSAPDGSNVSFVFSQKPTYIVSDHAWYEENTGWTWSGSTATLSVPPQESIWGFV